MWFILIAVIAILLGMLKYRETFIMKYGNPFDDEDLISFDRGAKGTRFFSTTPDTCHSTKSDLDAGLCYEPCQDGYHGVGPVCWADTVNVGIGKVLIMRSCYDSGHRHSDGTAWDNAGLFCVERITCASGLEFFTKGCSGGRAAWKQFTCDDYGDRENVDSLCYKKCPVKVKRDGTEYSWRHVPGMPYLCFDGSRGLSYGRGVGEIPPIIRFGE